MLNAIEQQIYNSTSMVFYSTFRHTVVTQKKILLVNIFLLLSKTFLFDFTILKYEFVTILNIV